MKWLNRNIRALDASLQEAPEILKSVCMNLPVNILLGMVNYLMDVFIKTVIRFQRVREQFGALLYVLFNLSLKRLFVTIRNYLDSDFAVSFKQSHHRDLATSARSRDLNFSLIAMHEPSFAADESFVCFNLPAQLLKGSRLHRESDSVHKEPCRLLSYAKRAVNFIRANAVLRRAYHPDSGHPLVEADGRIFHEGSKFDREHFLALFVLTLPRSARRYERDSIALAARTSDLAVWPSKRDHKAERVVRIVEVYDCLLKRLWEGCCFRFHDA